MGGRGEGEGDPVLILNLGCPKAHKGQVCVDRRKGGTVQADVYDYLEGGTEKFAEIRSKNLLEHVPDPGRLIRLAASRLERGGTLEIITDNAEFLPFYLPFWARHTGIGAHARPEYALDHCGSPHLMIFTKMHLRNLAELAGLEVREVRRTMFGARLKLVAVKRL